MKIDWVVVWQEFENELSNRLQEGVLNEWSMQQEIIERVIERNLTQPAPDAGESVPLQALSTPEHSATSQNLSTPTQRG
jgi:hypothetical protein